MQLWKKIDNFFAPPPAKAQDTAAAAAAAAAVLLYVKNLITRPARAEELIARVKRFTSEEKIPNDEEALRLYLELENHIVENEPMRNYTPETLRAEVRTSFRIGTSDKLFDAFFLPGTQPIFRLYEALLKKLARQLVEVGGEASLQRVIGSHTKGTILKNLRIAEGTLDFSSVYEKHEHDPAIKKEVSQRLEKLAEACVARANEVLGENQEKYVLADLEKTKKKVETLLKLQDKHKRKAGVSISRKAQKIMQNIGMGELVTEGILTNFETNLVSKEGKEFPMSISASTLKSDEGDAQGLVIAAMDLTGVRRLEREKVRILEHAKGEAEAEVSERTAQLEKSNERLLVAEKQLKDQLFELERFNKVAVGRELKMIELKQEIEGLKKEQTQQ